MISAFVGETNVIDLAQKGPLLRPEETVGLEDLETNQILCQYSLVRGQNVEATEANGIRVPTWHLATIGRSAA